MLLYQQTAAPTTLWPEPREWIWQMRPRGWAAVSRQMLYTVGAQVRKALSFRSREAELPGGQTLSGPRMEELFKHMDIIESEAGKIHGYLNWQGVLNSPFNLRGQDVFLDLGHHRSSEVSNLEGRSSR